jgi:hypothetical protein
VHYCIVGARPLWLGPLPLRELVFGQRAGNAPKAVQEPNLGRSHGHHFPQLDATLLGDALPTSLFPGYPDIVAPALGRPAPAPRSHCRARRHRCRHLLDQVWTLPATPSPWSCHHHHRNRSLHTAQINLLASRMGHFQVIAGLGSGIVLNTLLPACQAPLVESDQAAATATWAFIRSLGSIWGVAIPSAIFSSRTNALAYRVSDPGARAALASGQAYEHATSSFVGAFTDDLQRQIIDVYADSLQTVWQVAIAFSGMASLLVFLEKEVPLRKELDTNMD